MVNANCGIQLLLYCKVTNFICLKAKSRLRKCSEFIKQNGM